MTTKPFSTDLLKLDCAHEAERIGATIREHILRRFKKKGVVVALSGGIDSSVVAGLCAAALGKEKVLGLLMPERDSSADTLPLSRQIADFLGIHALCEDISGILETVGCYRRRDEAIKGVVPGYGPGWKSKIVLPNVLNDDKYRLFSLVAESPAGQRIEAGLPKPPTARYVALAVAVVMALGIATGIGLSQLKPVGADTASPVTAAAK